MESNMKETIVAISTGSSSGAISIVRMSGDKSIKIADRIFNYLFRVFYLPRCVFWCE